MSELKRYFVRMVFSVTVNGSHDHFDEQCWMVRDQDRHQAIQTAAAEGKKIQSDFLAKDGASISWKFEGVIFCIELPDQELSLNLFTSTVKMKESDDYLKYIHARWDHLLNQCPTKIETT